MDGRTGRLTSSQTGWLPCTHGMYKGAYELALKRVGVVFSGKIALRDTKSMYIHPQNIVGQSSAWLHTMEHQCSLHISKQTCTGTCLRICYMVWVH